MSFTGNMRPVLTNIVLSQSRSQVVRWTPAEVRLLLHNHLILPVMGQGEFILLLIENYSMTLVLNLHYTETFKKKVSLGQRSWLCNMLLR